MHKTTSKQILFKHKSASCRLSCWGNKQATIFELEAKKKRKGHATKLMKDVMKYADAKGLKVYILADRYGPDTFPSNKALSEFYETFGFEAKPDKPVNMFRRRSQDKHGV